MDDLFEALEVDTSPIVGHSRRCMFALCYAAARPARTAPPAVLGDPAVAPPGVTVAMPVPLMTVPALGPAILRTPSPQP